MCRSQNEQYVSWVTRGKFAGKVPQTSPANERATDKEHCHPLHTLISQFMEVGHLVWRDAQDDALALPYLFSQGHHQQLPATKEQGLEGNETVSPNQCCVSVK